MPTRRRSGPILVSVAFALALISLPSGQVAACRCAMGETDAQIREARLAFIGTVLDQRETGAANPIGDTMIEYAFEVERASAPATSLAVVTAGASEASCGITFGTGEEWLIIVPARSDMGDTHLCAGNVPLSGIGADERAEIEALLPVIPTAAAASTESGGLPPSVVPVLIVGAALFLFVAVGLFAFRRDRG